MGLPDGCDSLRGDRDGFSEANKRVHFPLPSAVVLIGYMAAFYFLSLCLEEIPIGVAYAVWSGVGIISIAVVSYLIYNQRPDSSAIIGMAFIITGIVIMRLFSDVRID